jgi:Lipocalin-like domain/CrtC N-terminal lipocalin domain
MDVGSNRLTRNILAKRNSMRGWIQVDPEKDLGSHEPLPIGSPQEVEGSFHLQGLPRRQADGDSYYLVSYVKDERGHPFTTFFHYFVAYKQALERLGCEEAYAQVAVSILDERDATKEGYVSLATQLTQPEIKAAQRTPRDSPELNIQTPLGSLQGAIDSIRLKVSLPKDDLALSGNYKGGKWEFDFTIKAQGLPLPYVGSGIIPFDNDIDYEYALPEMETSGALRFGDKTYQVKEGITWFDREWGHFGPCKWTWMAVVLPNGARIALWDQQNNNVDPLTYVEGQSAFATVLEPHGSIAVGSVDIQEEDRFTIPRSTRSYPKRWSVSIPSKHIKLRVQLLRDDQEMIPKQEIRSGTIITPRLEARAEVEGTYEDQLVKANAFVELFNLFPAFDAIRAQAAG